VPIEEALASLTTAIVAAGAVVLVRLPRSGAAARDAGSFRRRDRHEPARNAWPAADLYDRDAVRRVRAAVALRHRAPLVAASRFARAPSAARMASAGAWPLLEQRRAALRHEKAAECETDPRDGETGRNRAVEHSLPERVSRTSALAARWTLWPMTRAPVPRKSTRAPGSRQARRSPRVGVPWAPRPPRPPQPARSRTLEAPGCESRLPQRRSSARENPPDTLVDPHLRLM
jgi:hypothetical protein